MTNINALLRKQNDDLHAFLAQDEGEEVKQLRAELEAVKVERDRYRVAISQYMDGNFINPRNFRPSKCPHERYYYQTCEECIDAHFAAALQEDKHD